MSQAKQSVHGLLKCTALFHTSECRPELLCRLLQAGKDAGSGAANANQRRMEQRGVAECIAATCVADQGRIDDTLQKCVETLDARGAVRCLSDSANVGVIVFRHLLYHCVLQSEHGSQSTRLQVACCSAIACAFNAHSLRVNVSACCVLCVAPR